MHYEKSYWMRRIWLYKMRIEIFRETLDEIFGIDEIDVINRDGYLTMRSYTVSQREIWSSLEQYYGISYPERIEHILIDGPATNVFIIYG